jgi:hypothetical protein
MLVPCLACAAHQVDVASGITHGMLDVHMHRRLLGTMVMPLGSLGCQLSHQRSTTRAMFETWPPAVAPLRTPAPLRAASWAAKMEPSTKWIWLHLPRLLAKYDVT